MTEWRRGTSRWVFALLILIADCATPPAPELVAAPDAPESAVRALRYPRESPAGVVVLVHGLGTNCHIFDLPGSGGLAPELWHAGYEVICLDWSRVGRTIDQTTTELDAAIARVRGAGDGPLFGVGHGIGGTLLYRIAAQKPELFAGLAQLSAPLTFDGRTKAFAALLSAAAHLGVEEVSWARLRRVQLLASTASDGGFERTLLFTDPTPELRDRFYDRVDSPMSAVLLSSLAPLAQSEAAGPNALTEKLATHPGLPLLAYVAPGDGLAPAWQTDPAVLGLRRDNLERHYLTRANGTSEEYNHVDLLLHPNAWCEIFDRLIDWLGEQQD